MELKKLLATLGSLGVLGAVVYVMLVRTGWIPSPVGNWNWDEPLGGAPVGEHARREPTG